MHLGRSATWAVALTLTATMGAGCLTPLKRTERLEKRVAELEAHRRKLAASIEADVKRLEELHRMVKEAEATLRKSGVNLGIRTERLEELQPKLRGDLDALRFHQERLRKDVETLRQAMAQDLGVVRVLLPRELPKTADGMWRAAQERESKGELLVARALYQTFTATFPKDERAPQAAMAVAGLLERDGQHQKAIEAYANVETSYPQSPWAAKAVYRVGELLAKQGKCRRAKRIYEYLAKKYKGTAEAGQAEEQAHALPKRCK